MTAPEAYKSALAIARAEVLRVGIDRPFTELLDAVSARLETERDAGWMMSDFVYNLNQPPTRAVGVRVDTPEGPAWKAVVTPRSLVIDARKSIRSEKAPTEAESETPRGEALPGGQGRIIRKGEFPGTH